MKRISFALCTVSFLILSACGNDQPTAPGTDTPASETPAASSDGSPSHTNKEVTAAEYDQGLQLVATSDCLTCHKLDTKLIGPSYQDVANKYAYNQENIDLLSSHIMMGSSGVWGTVPMQAHPGLSKGDAQKMVKYVFAFKK